MVIKPTDRAVPISNGGVSGMDLRTWMATQFVAAFIAGAQASDNMIAAEGAAQAAVSIASTLIAELNK